MQPKLEKISIENNLDHIEKFIQDAIISPRNVMKEWSLITGQTPAAKIGYIGQHLASLITGVRGTGSGARGDDLIDGTEVKSCNKIDQVDECKDCKKHVMRYETKCSHCGSERISRKDDSKWLFSVKDQHELDQYKNLDRILLILMDYPLFKQEDYSSIRISAFEIYPKNERMKVFCSLIENHYNNIYLPKITGEKKKGNPMNLHPGGIQFYKCNPIQIFQCTIRNINTKKPSIDIDRESYIAPQQDRTCKSSLMMPADLLNDNEWSILLEKAKYEEEIKPLLVRNIQKEDFMPLSKKNKIKYLPFIDEKLREYIPLRDIKSTIQKEHYQR